MPELTLTTAQEVTLMGELWYNALPMGRFHDPRYGQVDITQELITKLAANLGKVPAYPPPVKLGHGDGAPSPGVVKAAVAKPDGLYLRMEVDSKATEDIKAGRYRYMSAEFSPDYLDKTTGARVGPTLLGVALVNQPAHPGVRPIVLSDGEWVQEPEEKKGGDEDMTLEEMKAALAQAEKEKAALLEEKKELSEQVTQMETQNKGALEDIARLKKEKHEAEIKVFCDKWAGLGIPPVVLDKVRPVLLAEGGGVIKLSDSKETSVKSLLNDVFEAIPKVAMRSLGDPQATSEQGAVKLGEAIAQCVNGTEGK